MVGRHCCLASPLVFLHVSSAGAEPNEKKTRFVESCGEVLLDPLTVTGSSHVIECYRFFGCLLDVLSQVLLFLKVRCYVGSMAV